MAHLRSGTFAPSVTDLTTLIKLRPADAGPLFFRANARLQNNDAKGADLDFTAFLTRQPGDLEARMGRALARQFAQDPAGAEADFSTVLKALPQAAEALAGRGAVRFMQNDFKGAAADFAAALSLPGAPPDLALWRFLAERRAGLNADPALIAAAKPLADGVWPAPVMHYFSGALEGDAVLAAAAQKTPGEPDAVSGRLCEAYFYLGEAALMVEDTAEAAKLFKAALDTGMTRYREHAAAQAELSRLKFAAKP